MGTLSDRTLIAEVATGLSRYAGLRFDPRHSSALWQAIQSRLQASGVADPRLYLQRLRTDEAEWLHLAEVTAIHETAFFRHAGQFRVMAETILPELIRSRAAERRLRLWSAACSTGEEPYSLAIAIHQLNLPADWEVRIVATDLSTRALAIARNAVFTEQRLRSFSPELRTRYFEPHGARFRLRDEVRSLVTFAQFNLSQPELAGYLREMDIVFCRNVLIYLVPAAVRQAVDHFQAALCNGGYLFLGYSETLFGMSTRFESVMFEDACVYRRLTSVVPGTPAERAHPANSDLALDPQSAPREAPRSPLAQPEVTTIDLQRTIDRCVDSGDLARASRETERWLLIEPDSLPARFKLARLYAAQERNADAARVLRELLARDPLHAPSYVLLGVLCSRQNETGEAVAQFQHALYLEPQTPLAHFFLGNIYQEQGQLRQALHAYRQALRLGGSFTPEWDSGFTPELLAQVCQRSIARLERAKKAVHSPTQ
jgi:chemotaxis protein methyltransferase CheR